MSKKRRGAQPATAPRRPPVKRRRQPDWLVPVVVAIAGVIALVLIVFAVVIFTRSGPSQPGPGLPNKAGTGQTVDGVQCQTQEQVLYHIHAHLAILGNGQPISVPMGIGIPDPQVENTTAGPFVVSGSCFYWLHTHDDSGVIHVESPAQRTYTLGDFFDIWGQPLSATGAAGNSGTVIAYVNGQRYGGDPRQIPLQAHSVIQLDVGTDVAPRPYTFANGL
jgi:hypothetical protein